MKAEELKLIVRNKYSEIAGEIFMVPRPGGHLGNKDS